MLKILNMFGNTMEIKKLDLVVFILVNKEKIVQLPMTLEIDLGIVKLLQVQKTLLS